jgi:hypothetical protein
MSNQPGSWTSLALLTMGPMLIGTAGCHRSESTPAPYIGPTISEAELGLEPTACDPTGFVIVEPAASEGRFPGGLAIARLAPKCEANGQIGQGNGTHWQLCTIRSEKATYWNSLFNTVPGVREVVMLDPSSVERPEAGVAEITRAARLAKCTLCLIWGPGAAQPGHARLMGVLMDARDGHEVALLQAEAGPEDFKPPAKDHFKADRRHLDVNYLAARKFEQQGKDCLFQLIARDRPLPAIQSSPWLSAATTRPAGTSPIPVYIVPNRPARW